MRVNYIHDWSADLLSIVLIKEAYDISATVDDYFLKSATTPYCGQAQRACANSLNMAGPHLNIYSAKFGRDAEF
jgi:hypothetical protein